MIKDEAFPLLAWTIVGSERRSSPLWSSHQLQKFGLGWLGGLGAVLVWLVAALGIVVSSWTVLATSGSTAQKAAVASAVFLVAAVVLGFAPSIQDSEFVSSLFGSSTSSRCYGLERLLSSSRAQRRLGVLRQVGDWRSSKAWFIGIATVGFWPPG